MFEILILGIWSKNIHPRFIVLNSVKIYVYHYIFDHNKKNYNADVDLSNLEDSETIELLRKTFSVYILYPK